MSRHFRVLLLTFLLAICFDGICSDSAYLCIRWNGPVDKPYHEFVFYKKGGYNPEQYLGPYGGNPFVSQVVLSAKLFEELKHILFANYRNPDSSDKSDHLFMSYYIGYFEGSNWILTNYMNNEADFNSTYKNVAKFFEHTNYEAEVKQRWKFIFDRLGIKGK